MGQVISEIAKYLPKLGEEAAMDSSVIRSHSNRNHKPVSDPAASSRRGKEAGVKI